MKLNKKLFAGLATALVLTSSASLAAVETKKLTATYGVNLNVNGTIFTVADRNMRPFVTQDGRTYVSIAALNQMNIASVNYDKNTKTVNITSGSTGSSVNSAAVAQLQAQVQSQAAEIARLQYENNMLKNSNSTNSSSSSKNEDGRKKLSDLTSSEKRELAKDIERDIRDLRAETSFIRSQRFDGSISISSSKVTLSLYQRNQLTSDDLTKWNEYAKRSSRTSDRLEEDYIEFIDKDVRDLVKSALKDYSGYDIEVDIFSTTKDGNSSDDSIMVNGRYNYNKDKTTATIYDRITKR